MDPTNPKKPAKELSTGCLSLFGLPFLLSGLFMTGLYFNGYVKWLKMNSWIETPCWIESAELESNGDTGQTTAHYRYTYQGRTYSSDQVTHSGDSDNIGSFQQDAYRELSKHAALTKSNLSQPSFVCYVNPDQPDEAVIYRKLRWEMQAFMSIFALTFPAVGAGLVFGGLVGIRINKKQNALRLANPDEPWRWNPAWSQNTIPESSSTWRFVLFAYTAWSGLIIAPLIAAVHATGAYQSEPKAWLTLIFVGLWCLPAWFTLKRIRHHRAVGTMVLEPAEMPFYPGGAVHGAILTKRPPPFRANLEITLTCTKTITTQGRRQNTSRSETVWSHTETVSPENVTQDINSFRIPIHIGIPADAPITDANNDSFYKTSYDWQLTCHATGTPIHGKFEIPVFRTRQSPAISEAATTTTSTMVDAALEDLPRLLAERRIQATFDDRNHPISIHCPMSRNRASLVFLILFNLIWSGIAVLTFTQNAPIIFKAVWTTSAIAIWISVIWNLLHQRTATFTNYGIELHNQLGPISWRASIPKSSIRVSEDSRGAQVGSNQFYKVRISTIEGKKYTLADNLMMESAATALARRIDEWRTAS